MTAEVTADLVRLAAHAPPQALALARAVLEQSVADAAWGAQIGPVLAQRDTARLLATTEQAVSKDRRLLRLRNRDGRPVYPVVQFDGRSRLDGVAEVVAALGSSLQPLTVAAWLTAANRALGGRRPVDLLRDGERGAVLAVARRLAASAA